MSARLRITVLVTTLILLSLLAGGMILLLNRMHDATLATNRATAERITRVAEATINRQFLQVDSVLAGLGPMLEQTSQGGAVQPCAAKFLLHELDEQNFGFRDLLLLLPDGRPWATALAPSMLRPPPLPLAELAQVPQQGAVAILGPVRNPLTGEWALFFARTITVSGPGRLLALAEVPVPLLVTLLTPLAEAPGASLSLDRADGQILTSLPHNESQIGQRRGWPAGTPAPQGSAAESTGRMTGLAAVIARRTTLYQDILVTTAIDLAIASQPEMRERYRVIMVGCAAAVLLLGMAFALDAALNQRERVDEERNRARTMMDNALEAMSDGFVMWDENDRLLVANQRYRELYARTGEAIHPGASFEDIIRAGIERGQYPQSDAESDPDAFVAELLTWHRGNNPPLERMLPDGRWILVTERRTPDGGTVGIRTDITALKRANRDMAAANANAARATEAKSTFLARMSHELRTPLNGVLGLAQALARDPSLSAAHRAQAATLEAAGRHLVAVANDVLDLARVESGQLELRPEPLALAELLQGCATMVHPAAEEKRITLRVELAEDLPLGVAADPTRLRQLLLNLLSNAIKFTPRGGSVGLRAAPLAAAANGSARLRLEVTDTGPGVPPDARQAIFGDYVQLERGLLGGAGLGLAISRHIAEAMGARIGCDSNPHAPNGALFWLEVALPLAKPPAPPKPATLALPGVGLRLLVADDVQANQAVARALLQSAGHTVDCVADGAEAVAALQRAVTAGKPYDAVLMDVMMPGMDGLEATRHIRALPGPEARTPIIAATASAFQADIDACHAAGMDAHLAKPIEREKLLAALASIGSRAAAPARTKPSPAAAAMSGQEAWADLPLMTRQGTVLTVRVPGLDPVAARRLVPEFILEIERGLEALETCAPLACTRPAHGLAGAAATLGAQRLAAVAQRLVAAAKARDAEKAESLQAETRNIGAETLGLLREMVPAEGQPQPLNA